MLRGTETFCVVFAVEEERFREADGVVGFVEGVAFAAPALAGKEGAGVHGWFSDAVALGGSNARGDGDSGEIWVSWSLKSEGGLWM